MNYIYETPPMKIGKHEWRIVVIPSRWKEGYATEYQFRRIGEQHWRSYRDWPTYNFNDGTWAGCPRSLRKLYYKHEAELQAWLNGEAVPQQELKL